MRRFLAFAFFAITAIAQTPPPGAIVKTTLTTLTVSAPGGAAVAGQLVCTLSNASPPTIHIVCVQDGVTVLTQDSTVPVGSNAPGSPNGNVTAILQKGNAISWAFMQATAGVVSWNIIANGTQQNGTF